MGIPHHWSAARLARLIRQGELSSRDAVAYFLARIERLNPDLNTLVHVRQEEALSEAEAADNALARGQAVGPLHGVPITVKDHLDVAGAPSTQGVRAFADRVAAADAPLVARLRAAGAIILGKTNMPDFGLRLHTDNDLFGPTRNPWSDRHTPGGSSGGEGAAIAAGLSPLGLGTDLGGSIRLPAHCCGILGLKPTLGRLPHASASPEMVGPEGFSLLAAAGPLATAVEDLELVLRIGAGYHPQDPTSAERPDGFADHRAADAPPRIALVTTETGSEVAQPVISALRAAAGALEAGGFRVEPAAPPVARELADAWRKLVFIELKALALPRLTPYLGPKASAYLSREVQAVDVALDLASYAQALADRRRLARAVAEWMEAYPLVLAPLLNEPVPQVGFDEHPDSPHTSFRRTRNLVWPNLLGLPALAVPVGWDDGVPQGVQIVGRRFREDQVLWAGAVLQAAFPTRRPD